MAIVDSVKLEHIIQQDIGNRGLGGLFPLVCNSLEKSTNLIRNSNSIAILTGFNIPPQETDGPSGAIALARALSFLGKRVIFVVDDFCHSILAAGIKASDGSYLSSASFPIEVFPKESNSIEEAQMKSMVICEKYNLECIISIEHVGPSHLDGRLYRMNGCDTTDNQGHSYIFFESLDKLKRIAIGDGGNELGCGKILASFLDKSICNIPHIEKIACRSTCDEFILSGVSNWGGYALALLLACTKDILSVEGERNILRAIVDAGAIDPHKGQVMFVDRLPFDPIHANVISELLK